MLSDVFWGGLSKMISIKQSHNSLLLQGVKPQMGGQDPPQHALYCKDTHKKKRLKLPGGVCSHEARSSWMLISLSRWVFLLFKPDPIFPLRISNLCKDLERVLAQVAPGSTGQEHPTLAGIAASQAHLSSQGHNSRFCHCHREGLPHRQEI